ncbi:MAG: family 78 glycoside hydrolase catalytic domain [Clostridia bacterium]|nr:family 78 glycoside hydrolase catalytic domain [Clostridia bacterium]
MPFNRINFIKVNRIFDPKEPGFAPMFRRRFTINEPISSAVVHVCGLGYAYYYLNGQAVTEDLFIAPVSDYRKTLWYTSYDVTDKLQQGENIFAVICGNGWYNENHRSSWNHHIAPWRDNPKFILELEVNGRTVLSSDEFWKCTDQSAIVYNQLRCGEHFDARLYDENWTSAEFDDSAWQNAVSDTTYPIGIFRPCPCEPIRVDRVYPAVSMTQMDENRYIFDFGQNMSGFVRLTVDQAAGDEIVIRYAEELYDTGEPNYNNMGHHYPETPFQTDRLICRDGKFTWSPKFVYHGFRYVEVTGIKDPTKDSAAGVFVHQAVDARSSFECSDPFLNELFRIGQTATWSNLFYMPTDCPIREKLGWCNDAQSSAEQMLTNFTTERLFAKWLQDIYDAMLPDGQLPGIIPSSGWGYAWGNGPVSDGILFEIPYRLYLHTGEKKHLIESLPYFDRYLSFLETREDENGDVHFGLDDWAHPRGADKVTAPFINSALRIKFLRIADMAAQFAGQDDTLYGKKLAAHIAVHKEKYMNADSTCRIDKQTAAAMHIVYGIYDNMEPLKAQLARLVEEKDFHHDCGMLGLPHLWQALNLCGLQDYAFRILTASGFPSYRNWIEDGATTLYEMWSMTDSKNHHMYSCYMAWMMNTIIGIRLTEPAYDIVALEPCFFEGLDWAKGHIDTPRGRVSVDWKKEADGVHVKLVIPDGMQAQFRGQTLTGGTCSYVI